jgi:hypothetical protein
MVPGLDGRQDDIGPVAFSPDGKTLLTGDTGGAVRLWEVATGRERRRLEGHKQGGVRCIAFAPGGRAVLSGSGDGVVMVWDVTAPLAKKLPRKGPLSKQELNTLWDALAADPPAAYRAIWALVGASAQAVPLLKTKLRSAGGDRQRLPGLLADLDSKRFEVRERASRELERFGEIAEPSLRKMLVGKPSLEVRRRVESLLDRLSPRRSPERLRSLRCMEVLEQIGTPAAGEVLTSLAKGATESQLTREARASLERLTMRQADRP